MPTPTLPQIMDAVYTRLLAVEGLRVSPTSPGQVTPPHAIVGVPAVPDYNAGLAGRSRADLAPTITVLTGSQLDRIGQTALATLANPDGTGSIPAAFAADRSLGGLVSDCRVASFEPLGLEEVGVIGYFGGRFTLRILL